MNNAMVMLGYCLVYAIWVLVPLLPAILIYRLFPKTDTQTQWKISGVALKAGGASGFYFAILALAFFKFIDPAIEIVKNYERPYWEVRTLIKFVDSDQKVITASSSEDQFQVHPRANSFKRIGDQVYLATLHFSDREYDVPDWVTLHFKEGEGYINLSELRVNHTDSILKLIDLTKLDPIIIRPVVSIRQSRSSDSGSSQQSTHVRESDAPRDR